MNNKLIKKIEFLSVIFLLLFSENLNIPFISSAIIHTVSYGIIVILVMGRLKQIAYVATKDISLLLLVGVTVASVLWSVSLSDTVAEIKAVVRSILFAIYFATQYTPREQIRLLSWVTGIEMILSFTVGLALPSYAFSSEVSLHSALRGIFSHKQTLGRFTSFAASIFLITAFDKKSNRWFALAGLCLAVILLLLSQSKTGFVAFVLLLVLMPLYRIVKQKRAKALSMVVMLLLFSTVSVIILLNLETIVVDVLGKNLEFDGRTPIWTLAIEKGMERPFFGYGYNAFWTSEASDYVIRNTWIGLSEDVANHTVTFHAHNSFIDIFLELGLLGLMIFLYNFITVMIRLVKLILITRKIEYFWMFQFSAFYLVYNMAEGGSLLSTDNILWITYVSIVFSSAIELDRFRIHCKLNAVPEKIEVAVPR